MIYLNSMLEQSEINKWASRGSTNIWKAEENKLNIFIMSQIHEKSPDLHIHSLIFLWLHTHK